MKNKFKNIIKPLFLISIFLPAISNRLIGQASAKFIKNNGQFHENIDFKLQHNAGNIYFEKSSVKYDLFQKDKINAVRHGDTNFNKILGHRYESIFIGSNTNTVIQGGKKINSYHNYFIGKDSTNWKSRVPLYTEIKYIDVYKNIDVKYYSSGGKLKYDFTIHPKASPENIKIKYVGIDSIYIKSGHLILKTSLGNVIEQAPLAYQVINERKQTIPCEYKLKNDIVSFKFKKKYDQNYDLVIDPLLIFSTYSGSSANNWGETATYDQTGHLYAGSIAFGNGYDVTTGAYDMFYDGGVGFGSTGTDICISKFSVNGDSLKYSTYLGGNGNENPHSLVVNSNDELFVLGSTGSANFPTTLNAYDTSFNGGDFFGFINYPFGSSDYYLEYPNGTDIVVTKFSSDGSSLVSSTFFGGTKNDGINESGANNYNGNLLCHFYADEYRGEIILDSSGNCYIASSSSSIDFPLQNSAQNNIGGMQDAVAFKLDGSLSNLLWSTYIGGSSDDAGYSIELNNNNHPIICGGTLSNDFATTANSLNQNYSGNIDGFVSKYNSQNGNILASSYVGDSGFNQCYFVQIDSNNDVYLFGLTNSPYPVYPPNTYHSIGSQFIHKIDNNLSNTLVSTSFGNGSLSRNITPSAFLVSTCGLIYISGWGGLISSGGVTNGSTNNMPLVNPSFIPSDTANFYLAVFSQDMQSMIYGSCFGGGDSREHVDGGTSRFDKNGKIYQAVCAGCQGNNDFPTTPNVYSSINGNNGCNLGAFKFDLESISANISLPNYYACLPNSFNFSNLSQGGNQYFWDFGDGNTSTLPNPNYTYSDTGTFQVTLIVEDSTGCINPDTSSVIVDVFEINNATVTGDSILCPGTIVTLNAYGGSEYLWYPSNSLSNGTGVQVIANPSISTTYMLIAVDSCSSDTAYFDVNIPNDTFNICNDTIICKEDSVTLSASGGIIYRWSGINIVNVDSANPTISPQQNTTYYLDITTPNGCIYRDSVNVEVEIAAPNIILQDTLNLCYNDSVLISMPNLANATWSPILNPNDTIGNNIWISSDSNIIYYVSSENACGQSLDSIVALVFGYSGIAFGDTVICAGDSTEIYAEEGIYYYWYPNIGLSNNDSSWTYAYPIQSINYHVIIENNYGCRDTFTVAIDVSQDPLVNAGNDFWMTYGDPINLNGSTGESDFYWESNSWLSCSTCLNPSINPSETTQYILHAIDSAGCENSDTVEVNIKGSIFTPNSFTPNDDGLNDEFEIKGENIKNFELWIYNRWGENIFHSSEISDFWDGKYLGNKCKIDTYLWIIEFLDFNQNFQIIKGHVNLLE